MSPSLGIILFARMSSARLPGKSLMPLGPTTLFERVVARARCLDRPMVLATSTDPSDDALCEASRAIGLPVFRGALDDVLDRACVAARVAGFAAFARLCGDRPFLPLEDMRRGLAIMQDSLTTGSLLDLVTSGLPQPVPAGLLTEIIRTESLERVRNETHHPDDREHVTSRFYAHQNSFAIHHLRTPLQAVADVHMSVDTELDRMLLGRVIDAYPDVAISEARAVDLLRITRARLGAKQGRQDRDDKTLARTS
jgi:spore coat polysaccharide biosynthesis protein SpsF